MSLVRWWSDTSGKLRRDGSPSRLMRWLTRCGSASASWSMRLPPLECPITITGSVVTESNTITASRRSASQL